MSLIIEEVYGGLVPNQVKSWCGADVFLCVWNRQVPQLELMLISYCDKNTTGQTLNTAQLSLHFIFNVLASILTA